MLTLILYILTSIFCGESANINKKTQLSLQDPIVFSESTPLGSPSIEYYCSYSEKCPDKEEKR